MTVPAAVLKALNIKEGDVLMVGLDEGNSRMIVEKKAPHEKI